MSAEQPGDEEPAAELTPAPQALQTTDLGEGVIPERSNVIVVDFGNPGPALCPQPEVTNRRLRICKLRGVQLRTRAGSPRGQRL